jgi:hypothetical protein
VADGDQIIASPDFSALDKALGRLDHAAGYERAEAQAAAILAATVQLNALLQERGARAAGIPEKIEEYFRKVCDLAQRLGVDRVDVRAGMAGVAPTVSVTVSWKPPQKG